MPLSAAQFFLKQVRQCPGLLSSVPLQPPHGFFELQCVKHTLQFIPHGATIRLLITSGIFIKTASFSWFQTSELFCDKITFPQKDYGGNLIYDHTIHISTFRGILQFSNKILPVTGQIGIEGSVAFRPACQPFQLMADGILKLWPVTVLHTAAKPLHIVCCHSIL